MAQVSVPDPSSFPLFTGSQTRTTQCLLPHQSTPYHHHPQLLPPSARIPCYLRHHPIILAIIQMSPPTHTCFTKQLEDGCISFRLQHPERVHSPPCSWSTWIMKTLTGNTITLTDESSDAKLKDGCTLLDYNTQKESTLTLFFVHTGHEDPDW